MEYKSIEIIYIGFILPGLFSLTLVFEGIYKIYRQEEGFFTFFLGVLFLISLVVTYLFVLSP